jgi:fructose-1,6-bisphosphatase I
MLALASSTVSFLAGGRTTVSRSTTKHAGVSMAVEAPAKPTELLYDLNEPVFPEVCEFAGVTLSRYVLEMARANPDKPELNELVSVMTAVERACKTISSLVRRSPMSGLTGLQEGGGSINVQGEEQKKLDVITNTVLKNALRFTGKMGVLASEEEDEPVGMEDERAETYQWNKEVVLEESGKYVAVFDPLDGSSNVDANIPTGTIFGIFEEPDSCEVLDGDGDGVVSDEEFRDCMGATLQSGNKLVIAGYCLYSAATELVMSFGGKTCQGFTLDEQVGEFVLTKPNMQVPARGKPIYSINEANRWMWDPELTEYITTIQKGEGETGKQYSSRYIGSMVGDVHRTLLYGGIFGYAGDKKNPNGKLRLLYEAAPMAFIVEAAGGAAVSGTGQRILDIDPAKDSSGKGVHQRVPVFLGSKDDVAEMRSYYK